MKRRALLIAGGAWLAGAATSAFAQTTKPLRRVEFVAPGTEEGFREFFAVIRSKLKELGYVEGRDLVLEASWGEIDTLASRAAAVVARKPDVIVTASSAAVAECKKATPTIPIVFASAANPVEQGFVASLQRPGGNITGVLLYIGLSAKITEIAREAFPKARRLAILLHEKDPIHRAQLAEFEPAAARLKFDPVVVRISSPDDFDRAFAELARRKAEVLYLPNAALFQANRRQLAERALNARLPLLGTATHLTENGGLMDYGTRADENYQRAAVLVDKILRGAKPGDLPVERPEKIFLVINMKTAKAIGAKLPEKFITRADKVIE